MLTLTQEQEAGTSQGAASIADVFEDEAEAVRDLHGEWEELRTGKRLAEQIEEHEGPRRKQPRSEETDEYCHA